MPSFTLKQLAATVGATVHGDADPIITGVASLANAKPGHLSYLSQPKYRRFLATTQASAVIVSAKNATHCPTSALLTAHPELAFARIAAMFQQRPTLPSGIGLNTVIGDQSAIDPTVSIGANCVIGDRVKIGAHSVIHPGVIIQDDVVIGEHSCLFPNVTLYAATRIGNRVTIHSGAVIGADGFGLVQHESQWLEMPQLGKVVIHDDVLIGANTCIDRGALGDTVIEQGVKLDNLIQIGHNVRLGAHTVVAGSVGIAGSADIGSHCLIGGGTCINGHITITDQVVITGMSMVIKSIHRPGVYSSGVSVQPNRLWHKIAHYVQQLPDLVKRLKQLEDKLHEQ